MCNAIWHELGKANALPSLKRMLKLKRRLLQVTAFVYTSDARVLHAKWNYMTEDDVSWLQFVACVCT